MDKDLMESIKEFGMTFVLPLAAVAALAWLLVGISYLIDPTSVG